MRYAIHLRLVLRLVLLMMVGYPSVGRRTLRHLVRLRLPREMKQVLLRQMVRLMRRRLRRLHLHLLLLRQLHWLLWRQLHLLLEALDESFRRPYVE